MVGERALAGPLRPALYHRLASLYADELATLDDDRRCSARVRSAMALHVVAVLRAGVSVVLDFPASTPGQRAWLRSLVDAAGMSHELHRLDVPDEVCRERLRRRNTSGEHAFVVSDEQFDQFTRHFVPPAPGEGFHIITLSVC